MASDATAKLLNGLISNVVSRGVYYIFLGLVGLLSGCQDYCRHRPQRRRSPVGPATATTSVLCPSQQVDGRYMGHDHVHRGGLSVPRFSLSAAPCRGSLNLVVGSFTCPRCWWLALRVLLAPSLVRPHARLS